MGMICEGALEETLRIPGILLLRLLADARHPALSLPVLGLCEASLGRAVTKKKALVVARGLDGLRHKPTPSKWQRPVNWQRDTIRFPETSNHDTPTTSPLSHVADVACSTAGMPRVFFSMDALLR